MKIRSQRNQLIDMVGKATTTVRTPTGSYQILAHTKDKKVGIVLGEYSTEPPDCFYEPHKDFPGCHLP